MKEKVDQLLKYVQFSLLLCNEAYNEIWNITQTPNTNEEYDLVNGKPFSFYSVSLQYCFILEYTKLVEDDLRAEDKNVASLNRLNRAVSELAGNKYDTIFNENRELLSEIRKSILYERFLALRNNRFGHSGDHPINPPFKIVGFTDEQIIEMGKHVKIFLKITNNCFEGSSATTLGIANDDRTANFIRYHAKYKQYYFKNFIKAEEEGYGLR
jgi:hypothetical protein